MRTFFRRIRKELLQTGRVRRYLLYAVGEVLLVMIGILLALQVNNWNVRRLETKSWNNYSSRLYNDLQQDTTEIAYLLSGLDRKQDALHHVKDSLLNKSNSRTILSELAEYLLQGEKFGWGQFSYSGTTFKDLQNTGNLGLIRDEVLRVLVVDYYENWEFNKARISERKSNFPKLVYEILSIEFNPTKFGDSKQLRNSGNLQSQISLQLKTELLGEVQHELNYARFVEVVLSEINTHAITILQFLESSKSSRMN